MSRYVEDGFFDCGLTAEIGCWKTSLMSKLSATLFIVGHPIGSQMGPSRTGCLENQIS